MALLATCRTANVIFSSMTPNALGQCHTTVPDFKPTAACRVREDEDYSWREVTRTNVDSGTTRTMTYQAPSLVSVSRETHTTTFQGSAIGDMFIGISHVPMVTIVHHQSDLPGKSSAHGDSTATATTGAARSTSNVASKVGKSPKWHGLGAVLGCSAAAVALGMAIIFQ